MPLSIKTIRAIRMDYLSGMSLQEVTQKHSYLPRSHVRRLLEGLIRPRMQRTSDPSEEEVARLRDEINRQWTAEQAKLRWVGRYVSRPEELGSCLSRAIRAIGGDA